MNIMLFEDIPKFISLKDPRGWHIKKVLRLQAGDCLKAGLLNGPRGSLCITTVETEGYRVEWSESAPAVGLYPLTLLVGFVRPISVKRILREAASLGVERLVFAVTDSGERSYREANLWKTGEYREYLINGLQTAGATVLPEVVLAGGVEEALKVLGAAGVTSAVSQAEASGQTGAGDGCTDPVPGKYSVQPASPSTICLVLDNVSEGQPLSKVDLAGTELAGPRPVVLGVGSERGWSERERGLFQAAGFSSVTLGSRVLRTETACSTGTALTLARMGVL